MKLLTTKMQDVRVLMTVPLIWVTEGLFPCGAQFSIKVWHKQNEACIRHFNLGFWLRAEGVVKSYLFHKFYLALSQALEPRA